MLLRDMDDEIARVYEQHGATGIRPRFAMPLIRLGRRGPMTIRELAESLEVTHSAMSQTVGAMHREGLVTSDPGADARSRVVSLTDSARELLPLLESEWRATELALADLEDEIPYPLSQVVTDIDAVLSRRPFRERIVEHLQAPDRER